MPADHLSWAPADVDVSRPNAARVYDYVLGGANNFEVDREFARHILTMLPDAKALAQENRGFLRRTVSYLVRNGVRQFIDLGSGIPTVGNTHEVAQRVDPDARVVYVDNEPVAVAHGELILQDNRNAGILRADVRDADDVLKHDVTRELVDFDQPVAILAFAVLHFIPDEQDPYGLVATYRDATAPGSYLAISHLTSDRRPEVGDVSEEYRRAANPVTVRDRAAITRFFDGYDLAAPGVVVARDWQPEIELDYDATSSTYGAVGRKA